MPGGLYCLFIKYFTAAPSHTHIKYTYSTPLTSNRQTLLSDFTAYSSHSGGCHHHFLLTLFSPCFLISITLPCFCSLWCLLHTHVLPEQEQNKVVCSKTVDIRLHCCDPVLSQSISSDLPLAFNIRFKLQVLWGTEHIFASCYFER